METCVTAGEWEATKEPVDTSSDLCAAVCDRRCYVCGKTSGKWVGFQKWR